MNFTPTIEEENEISNTPQKSKKIIEGETTQNKSPKVLLQEVATCRISHWYLKLPLVVFLIGI
jgi:hypothetical protein